MLISIKQEKTSDSFDQNNQNPFIILISLKSLDLKALIQKKSMWPTSTINLKDMLK